MLDPVGCRSVADRQQPLARRRPGTQLFTWPAENVAQMARIWRNSDTSRAPEQARLLLDAHQRLEALASEAGLGPADVITHDLGRAEIRGGGRTRSSCWWSKGSAKARGPILSRSALRHQVAAGTAPDPVYERLAYEAAQRALDNQERLIDELRRRTGLRSPRGYTASVLALRVLAFSRGRSILELDQGWPLPRASRSG